MNHEAVSALSDLYPAIGKVNVVLDQSLCGFHEDIYGAELYLYMYVNVVCDS